MHSLTIAWTPMLGAVRHSRSSGAASDWSAHFCSQNRQAQRRNREDFIENGVGYSVRLCMEMQH